MKTYLVGGAVRDKLLDYPVKEKDWVVVGATPETMIKAGFRQVGRSFPVFLHPKTNEEYALARTERKQGVGYHGFACDFNPNVTLEEDLQRRDLTINAMAMDAKGGVIDPYGGQKDLTNRVLRHVSPAFVEDPVRVLRVARFAARYHHLGFTLADETRCLMYTMVQSGELGHLVAERVWQEWQCSLEEKSPEVFITTLRACGALEVILPEVNALFGMPSLKTYHPEVDSGVHTLMVLKSMCALSSLPELRFAALVHDLGKGVAPYHQWPSQQGHETKGVAIVELLCKRLRIPTNYRKLAVTACRQHLKIHRFSELTPEEIVTLLDETDAFRRPQQFEQLLLVCEADAKGRLNAEKSYNQAQQWLDVFQLCQTIAADSVIKDGFQGQDIKIEIRQRRIAKVKQFLETL